jgi:hypothetical protein
MVCVVRVAMLSTLVAANDSFWSKVNDDSIDDVMQNSPGFRQMIQTSCEMITLGRAGYPKNIPKETVDKLCLKMYPAYANKDKKPTSSNAQKGGLDPNTNQLILGVVIVGIVWYIWSASAPGEVHSAAAPATWAINQLAQDGNKSPPGAATQQPAFPGAGTVATAAPAPVLVSPTSTPVSPAEDTSPSQEPPSVDQVLEQRRARLSRFDSETERS